MLANVVQVLMEEIQDFLDQDKCKNNLKIAPLNYKQGKFLGLVKLKVEFISYIELLDIFIIQLYNNKFDNTNIYMILQFLIIIYIFITVKFMFKMNFFKFSNYYVNLNKYF